MEREEGREKATLCEKDTPHFPTVPSSENLIDRDIAERRFLNKTLVPPDWRNPLMKNGEARGQRSQ